MEIPFPILGLVEGLAAGQQQVQTSFLLQNVRGFDVIDERRGGQRAGTVLAYTTQIAGDFAVIDISSITTTYIIPE